MPDITYFSKRGVPKKMNICFEKATVTGVTGRTIEAHTTSETGIYMDLMDDVINSYNLINEKIEVLGVSDEMICFGARLLDGTVIVDSCGKHFNELRRYSIGDVHKILYGETKA